MHWHVPATYPKPPGLASTKSRLNQQFQKLRVSGSTLASLCSLANCADGANPAAGLIADAKGNLFGTAFEGGNNNNGTVFEVTGSGFVVPPIFAGTPGKPN